MPVCKVQKIAILHLLPFHYNLPLKKKITYRVRREGVAENGAGMRDVFMGHAVTHVRVTCKIEIVEDHAHSSGGNAGAVVLR